MAKKSKTRPPIPSDVKTKLWLTSGGRCQFDGCNESLWRDALTCNEMNRSYIAHIYGYAEGSARYDTIKSPKLEKDFSNLMLLCDTHHRMIDDIKRVSEYTAERLIEMKKVHEQRIDFLTSINPDKKSHVILFGARIGEHDSPLHFKNALEAMLPHFYPASPNSIELGLHNSSFKDSKEKYWEIQIENLETLFSQRVAFIKAKHEVQHFSIFALAPQPLLIKLGTLLNDIYPAQVYQLHREPSTWCWVDEDIEVLHQVSEADGNGKVVALKFELSATITDERIKEVIGNECEIWSIYHNEPNNDYIRNKNNLQDFRRVMRLAFDRIKAKHGQDAELHIFPAMPVSVAVELGRVWMPKADLPMIIYDQNYQTGGFLKALTINH